MTASGDKGEERPAAADPSVPTDPSSSVAGLSDSPAASPQRPLLTVVRGEPTPEQLAALIAVVSARASGGDAGEAPTAPSLWSRPQLRTVLTPGPGAWRASALPR